MSSKDGRAYVAPGIQKTAQGRFRVSVPVKREDGKWTSKHHGTVDTEQEAREIVARLREEYRIACPAKWTKKKDQYDFDELVRWLFDYDPETGLVWRKEHTRVKFYSANTNGYVRLNVRHRGKTITRTAHRVAFFLMEGRWPEGIVDHINGVRNDNRWVNLRHTTFSGNNANKAFAVAQRNVIRFNGRYYPIVGDGYATPQEAALVAETM